MNAMQRIKFGFSLMFPENKYKDVLREMFSALNQADRSMFPDADSLRDVLAGVVHSFGIEDHEPNPRPPLAITWSYAIADNLLAFIPKAIQYVSEVAPHGKNVELAQAQLLGIDLSDKSLTVGELATFIESNPEKRQTSQAYIRAEITRGNLHADKSVDIDPQSPLMISVDESRKWLLNPKRGSRKTENNVG